jgi:hypothetical protein
MRFSGKIILRQAQDASIDKLSDASIVVFPENWSYPHKKMHPKIKNRPDLG